MKDEEKNGKEGELYKTFQHYKDDLHLAGVSKMTAKRFSVSPIDINGTSGRQIRKSILQKQV